MRPLAALAVIGLGVLFAFATCSGPPADGGRQAGTAVADRPTDNLPLPSRERVGQRANLPLPSRERVGVRGEEGVKSKSATPAPSDPDDPEPPAEDDSPLIDPLSANAACYVCHMTFIREEFSQVHLKEKITCVECHGVSGPHANDENIGATPPDITFERHQVDASCAECHEEHDVPATKIIARSLERRLPDSSPICTDCHGTHKIEEVEENKEQEGGSGTADSEPATED